jgi:hypothetical protein
VHRSIDNHPRFCNARATTALTQIGYCLCNYYHYDRGMREWLPRSALVVFGITLVLTAIGFSRTAVFSHLMATDAGSPGDWHLEYWTDWTLVGIAAALFALLVTCVWLAARAAIRGRGSSPLPYAAAAVLVAVALVVGSVRPHLASGGCDGSVPRWMLPADYHGSGCIPWPENWRATQPWAPDDLVCLGLCADSLLQRR